MTAFTASPAPHLHSEDSTRRIMLDVIIALLPAVLTSVWLFGWRALCLELICVAACIAAEYLSCVVLKKPSSVGLPYPGQELKIVDGELWLRGENIMDGYLDPEANKQVFCDGWLRTGDLVRLDEEGFLYITGRIKEVLVLPSGEKVSPAELETLFNTIEAVQDSLVYVDSHGVLSLQVVPRQVVLKAQGIADPEAHIRAEVEKINAGLPGFERVSKIIVRDADFERSPSMKILREKNAQSDHS